MPSFMKDVYPGRVIFDHIPKTAGTSLHVWLSEALGNRCVTEKLLCDHNELIERYGGAYSVLCAHMSFEGAGLDPRYSYFTCLRDPIDRAVSWLYFVQNNHDEHDFPELHQAVSRLIASDGADLDPILLGHLENVYVKHFSGISPPASSPHDMVERALEGIASYEIVGFFESMSDFVRDVAELFELPPGNISHVGPTRARPKIVSMPTGLRARIESLNNLDIEFYSKVRSVRQRKTTKNKIAKSVVVSPWRAWEQELLITSYAIDGFVLLSSGCEPPRAIAGQVLQFTTTFSIAWDVDELELGIQILDEQGRCSFGTSTTLQSRFYRNICKGTYKEIFYVVANLPAGNYTAGFGFSSRDEATSTTIAGYMHAAAFQIDVLHNPPGNGYSDLAVMHDLQFIGPLVSERHEIKKEPAAMGRRVPDSRVAAQ